MLNLFIDNCSLLQLVNINGHNIYLNDLENFINSGKIAFITHEVTIEEWNKHKEKQKNAKARKIKFEMSKGEAFNTTNTVLPSDLTTISHLENQNAQIDLLLSNAIVIKTPDGIKEESHLRVKNRLAPFHRKIDSINDWEIIGSLGIYCQKYEIDEVYFISNNSNDFGNETDGFNTIHLDIQKRFSKLKIKYYKDYSLFFKELTTSSKLLLNSYTSYSQQNERYTYKSSIKKTVHESILYIYETLYEGLQFIPIHILLKYYPFSKSETSVGRFSTFTLYNVNDDFLRFAETFEVMNSNTILLKEDFVDFYGDTESLKLALKSLSRNLVYRVRDENNGNLKSIYYSDNESCNCARCNFYRFDFFKVFNILKDTTSLDIYDKLLKAYINYKIGNFKLAAKLYIEISQDSLSQNKVIVFFISQFNLKKIYPFLSSYYYNRDNIDSSLLDHINKIDLNVMLINLKASADHNLLYYIYKEDFFNLAFQKISKIVDGILSHYYSQLVGGWASNKYVWELIEEFTKLDSFINSNLIVYDKYSNFEDLLDLVLKGLVASHALKEGQGAKLDRFDDYWIEKILYYGRKDRLIKYCNDFNVKYLKYTKSDHVDSGFLIKSIAFFENEKVKDDIDVEVNTNGNVLFKDFYNRLFENIVTVGSVIELNRENLNKFSKHLILYLILGETLNYQTFSVVKNFLILKGKLIDDQILDEFLEFFLDKYRLNLIDDSFFSFLFKSYDQTKLLKIEKRKFDLFLKKSLQGSRSNQIISYDSLLELYKKSSKIRRQIITKCIKNRLELDFDFDMFVFFTINDILPLDIGKVLSLFRNTEFKSETHTLKSIFNGVPDNQDYYLDELLNIYFKFGFLLDYEIINKIRSINLYYEWVIDMDNFNYENFVPEWISRYQSIYYIKKMSASHKLIINLFEHIKRNDDPMIKEVLLKIIYHSGEF